MKRSDFLKATLLAPLAGLFGWKAKPEVAQAEYLKQQAWLLGLTKPETVYRAKLYDGIDGELVKGWPKSETLYGVAMEDVPAGGSGLVWILPQKEWEQRAYLRMLDS